MIRLRSDESYDRNSSRIRLVESEAALSVEAFFFEREMQKANSEQFVMNKCCWTGGPD